MYISTYNYNCTTTIDNSKRLKKCFFKETIFQVFSVWIFLKNIDFSLWGTEQCTKLYVPFFQILYPLYRVYISKAFFLLLADCFEMYARESKILTKSKHHIEYISGDGSGAHKIGFSGTPKPKYYMGEMQLEK